MGVAVMERERKTRIWARRDRATAEPRTRVYARQMRADPTDAEKKLWRHLRHRLDTPGTHFRRQVVIADRIADFVSHSAKLIIELDGGQHDAEAKADAVRTRQLEAHGYRVRRFWNNDVLTNVDGVLEQIRLALTTATPTPDPSPQGGGEQKQPGPP